MSENLNRIKAKIEKLFNLAENASNEHEAANAMAKARALMDAYQLSRIDILTVNGEDKQFSTQPATRVFNNLPKYMNILSCAVAQFNDCQSTLQWDKKSFKVNAKSFGKKVVFKGYKHDVDMAVEMFDRLMFAVNNLCARWLVENGWEGKYPVGIGNKFKYGACVTIIDRLEELKIERQKLTTSIGTSLVVVKGAAVAEYFGDVTYSKVKGPKVNYEDDPAGAIAYNEGRKRGEQVEIHRAVED